MARLVEPQCAGCGVVARGAGIVVCEADQIGYATIEVAAMAGDHRHPAAEGPAAITAALHDAGCEFLTHRVSIPRSTGEVIADSIRVSTQLRDAVRAVVEGGDVPIVLAGSCDVAPAVLAGIRRPDAGVIWLDAHADFNTPQSSVTGFWPGMTLAVIVGDCGENVWSALDWHPVDPERVVLIGVRSLSPDEESLRLERSALRVVPWRDGLPQHDVETALEALAQDVDDVYLHLDLDVLDPSVGRGVVDPPVAGGLSSSQLAELITEIRERLGLDGATIATYTPANDDGRTLPVAIGSIRQLTGHPG
jgi:arginase